MEDFTIIIYCFVDDYLKGSGSQEDVKRKMSNAEIITTALVSARYFSGNFTKGRDYMRTHHGSDVPDKSNFNRQLHRLSEQILLIFLGLGQTLKELNLESEYIIDSFPIAVCHNIRIKRSKMLQGKAYKGYNHSKRSYFYGFKVQVITTADGIPVECFIAAGSFHDTTIFRAMNIDLPEQSILYADSGYTDYQLEDYYKELEKIHLLVQRKSNSKRADHPALAYIKKQKRKRIETSFSEIEAYFPKKIHAVTAQGFLIKVFLFIFAYTVNRIIL